MKKVSVIVPIYNIEKFLPTCLESITTQTYKNIEIICIDDGSTDNSAEIVRSFMKNDERIVFIQKENGGLSSARNAGIEKITGEYVVFVDGDDWIDENTVEIAVQNECDLVMWDYISEFPTKSIKKEILDGDRSFDENECRLFVQRRMVGLVGEELVAPQKFDALVTAWGKMYRADIIKTNKLNFVDTKIIGTEDALFNLQYTGFCKNARFISKPLSHYRKDNSDSLTRTYKAELFDCWQELYSRMNKYIEDNNCPQIFSEALKNRICWSIVGLGIIELLNSKGALTQISNLRKILKNERYVSAYKELKLSCFPLYWRIFFLCCKNKMSVMVYILLKVMNYLIEK